MHRIIRPGGKITLFTVGYERRRGDELIALLRDAAVDVLVDVRARPNSRVADFRAKSLERLCAQAKIAYEGWPQLGSTDAQRQRYKQTGDFKTFASQFRRHVLTHSQEALDQLAQLARRRTVALLCYERLHEDCHRSIVADLVAQDLNATIVAI